MAKVYILTDKDIEELYTRLKLDPEIVGNGIYMGNIDKEDRVAIREAYRWFNYHLHKWFDEIKK